LFFKGSMELHVDEIIIIPLGVGKQHVRFIVFIVFIVLLFIILFFNRQIGNGCRNIEVERHYFNVLML
jgi:hypothetical protein